MYCEIFKMSRRESIVCVCIQNPYFAANSSVASTLLLNGMILVAVEKLSVFYIIYTIDMLAVVCPMFFLIYLQYFTRCGALRSSLTNIVTDYFNTFTQHTLVYHGIIVVYFNQGTLMVTHFSQLTTVGANIGEQVRE